jgi:hypothetical protein
VHRLKPRQVYVIRNRLLINHTEPERREIVDEVTLLNDSKSSVGDVFLARLKFMPALRILNNDGTELPYYPNDYTRQLIAKRLVNKDKGWQDILDQINSKKLFVLWISFPSGKEIQPGEARVIRLMHLDSEKPTHLYKSIFSVPRYIVEKVTPPDETYNTFIVISAPSGFRLNHKELEAIVKNRQDKLAKSDGLFVDRTDNLLSLRVPFLQSEVKYKMAYNVELPSGEAWFYRIGLVCLVLFSILTAIAPLIRTPLVFYKADALGILSRHRGTAAGLVITLSIAGLGFLTNPVMRRTKMLFLLPLFIVALGLMLV